MGPTVPPWRCYSRRSAHSILFQYIFSDTGAEPAEVYEKLDVLEQYLGQPITRIKAEKGLYEMLDEKDFLPSPQARWCTFELKGKPFMAWMNGLGEIRGQINMFVGLRADEPKRVAFNLPNCRTILPFRELGMVREDVFSLLDKTVGIPTYYKRRSRSGCDCCPYQSKTETVGLWHHDPKAFQKVAGYEKLSPAHAEKTAKLPDTEGLVLDDAFDWAVGYPATKQTSISGRWKHGNVIDLFDTGSDFFFVAVERMMVSTGFQDFPSHTRILTYSTTMAGIKKQIQNRYNQVLATGEVFGLRDRGDEPAHA